MGKINLKFFETDGADPVNRIKTVDFCGPMRYDIDTALTCSA